MYLHISCQQYSRWIQQQGFVVIRREPIAEPTQKLARLFANRPNLPSRIILCYRRHGWLSADSRKWKKFNLRHFFKQLNIHFLSFYLSHLYMNKRVWVELLVPSTFRSVFIFNYKNVVSKNGCNVSFSLGSYPDGQDGISFACPSSSNYIMTPTPSMTQNPLNLWQYSACSISQIKNLLLISNTYTLLFTHYWRIYIAISL